MMLGYNGEDLKISFVDIAESIHQNFASRSAGCHFVLMIKLWYAEFILRKLKGALSHVVTLFGDFLKS